jgi:rubrerythrin
MHPVYHEFMNAVRLVETPAQLYAQAIATEREAAERYAELAERMDDEGREDLARIFAMLAAEEAEHLETLERRTQGIELPPVAEGTWSWIGGAPETAAREFVYRLMSPRQALAMALQAERRAQVFFEQLSWAAPDPGVRALAREMAAEEREHVALVRALLDDTPQASLDTTVVFEK